MKIDKATVGGIVIGAVGLFAGFRLEGIQLCDLGQLTAALVVFFGTAAAVLISMPLDQVKYSLRIVPTIFDNSEETDQSTIEEVMRFARLARLNGLMSLETELPNIENPFLQNAIHLAIDNVGPDSLRSILESDIVGMRAQMEKAVVFYESAAGYAPTLGMAGAAIGLIQVMKNLEHIDQVGMGVAAAFVATIYGVLLANLVLLPIATKIRARTELRAHTCNLILEGALCIAAGLNPTLIRLKLQNLAQVPREARKIRTPATLAAQAAQIRES